MSDCVLLTVAETARRMMVSVRHVWGMVSAGKFGPDLIRLGRAVRVRSDELSEWLAAGAPSRDCWIAQRGGVTPSQPLRGGKR